VTEILDIAEQWFEDYYAIRPHEALQSLPPCQYEAEYAWFPQYQKVLISGGRHSQKRNKSDQECVSLKAVGCILENVWLNFE